MLYVNNLQWLPCLRIVVIKTREGDIIFIRLQSDYLNSSYCSTQTGGYYLYYIDS